MGLQIKTYAEAGGLSDDNKPNVSRHLLEMARRESDSVLTDLESRRGGLGAAEAQARLTR